VDSLHLSINILKLNLKIFFDFFSYDVIFVVDTLIHMG
jgi:hypothetical protein